MEADEVKHPSVTPREGYGVMPLLDQCCATITPLAGLDLISNGVPFVLPPRNTFVIIFTFLQPDVEARKHERSRDEEMSLSYRPYERNAVRSKSAAIPEEEVLTPAEENAATPGGHQHTPLIHLSDTNSLRNSRTPFD